MPPEEARGSGWIRALHPDDVDVTLIAWRRRPRDRRAGRPRIPRSLEGRRVPLDARARAAARRDASGRILRWYGTLEDVHERRLAVTALRESEEFARSILEASTTAIEVLDEQGRLIFINGPGIRVMEVDDPAAIAGRPFESFWPADVAPAIRDAITGAVAGETVRQTLFGPTAKGAPRWWDIPSCRSRMPRAGSGGCLPCRVTLPRPSAMRSRWWPPRAGSPRARKHHGQRRQRRFRLAHHLPQ